MLSEIKSLDRQYFMNVFGERFPVCFDYGKDCKLYDTDGNEYTDFFAGIAVNALGYSDEGFKKVLHNQIDKLLHTSSVYYVASQARAAKALCDATGMDRVFFANSGAEAMEGALKLARKYFYNKGENRWKVISMVNSFHGRTMATLTATGQPHYHEPFSNMAVGSVYVPYKDIDALKAAIDDETCAILLEPLQGEGGVTPAGGEFLKAVRDICDEHGILMITDEIQSGMGRTGSFLCTQKYGVEPDIVTLAKALGGGVPVGAFAAKQFAADAFVPGDHGSTFGGNHLATTAAEYMVTKLADPAMLETVKEAGAYLYDALKAVHDSAADKTDEPRGEGLLLALPIKQPLAAKEFAKKLLERKFVVGTAGGNCLRFAPPYVISKDEIDALKAELIDILEDK